MKLKPVLLVFAGPQGSGKGTQATLLAEQFDLPLAVAGDLIRTVAQEKTELGHKTANLINNGQYVTLDIWEQIIGEYLRSTDLTRGIILDGFIRTMDQVHRFNDMQQEQTLPPILIINLTLPRDRSIERLLKRGRHDDTMEAIERRLKWSETDVKPAVDYYREIGQVIDINGDQAIDEVHDEIVAKLTDGGWVEN